MPPRCSLASRCRRLPKAPCRNSARAASPPTDKALNIAAFKESGSLEFGDTGVTLPSARNFASHNEDLGLIKRFAVGERITAEFRLEALNA